MFPHAAAEATATVMVKAMRILYVNVIEEHASWGAEWFVDRGLKRLGHTTQTIDYRRHRARLPELLAEAAPYNAFFLQRGDYFPIDLLRSLHGPRFFWASELLSRCRDQDPLLASGLFDHVFFHSQRCADMAVGQGWLAPEQTSVLLNGFDEELHRPLPEVDQDIDVLFAGSMTPRRQAWLDRLDAYVPVTVLSAYGEELVRAMARAKIVLNLHAEECLDTETRVFETLGCGAFLLTERLSAENPFTNGELVQCSGFDDLRRKAAYYLQHADERRAIAARGREEAVDRHTYTHRAQQISEVMQRFVDSPHALSVPACT